MEVDEMNPLAWRDGELIKRTVLEGDGKPKIENQ